MRPIRFLDDSGATAVEFALTLPAFLLLLFAIFNGALMLWTQLALQHGVERAARCAAVNTAMCGSTSAIQNYAVANSFGLAVPASSFTVTTPSCGIEVNARYTYGLLTSLFDLGAITLTAQSCFPK